ncbi:MAG: FAD-binding protein [Bacteroidales bacterium]|nr:FAD-binding protein [Bacteroidales bacterium]
MDRFRKLASELAGELFTDKYYRSIYATDASVFRIMPLAVVFPKNNDDLRKLILFANKERLSLIPRGAGTSLAGQAIGKGIIVDVSKYLDNIIELNTEQRWVIVQPGIILNELNRYLEPFNLFFGPETSTSNRCNIGGMIANNSCGLHSLIYGSAREHTLEIKAFLSDGSEVLFKPLSKKQFNQKLLGNNLENKIYRYINNILLDTSVRDEISKQFPDKSIKRRNSGYAIDLLAESSCFKEEAEDFNFCKLLCGSEGSLALFSEIKLSLVPINNKEKALLCVHLNSVIEAMYSNLIALKHKPNAVELVDKIILDLTKTNIEQQKNRFFIEGDPGAVLIIEIEGDDREDIKSKAEQIKSDFLTAGFGFAFPLIFGNDKAKVWALRNAGLGILSNIPGDAKPLPIIEDTAISVQDLPGFFIDFQKILKELNLESTYYAHIGTGEIHTRPIINIKTAEGRSQFHNIARLTALLVKSYKGSLSGEHGDGRLRGEFIKMMFGEKIYSLFLELKQCFDVNNIFNPGIIVDVKQTDDDLRFCDNYRQLQTKTLFNYSESVDFLRAIEKCNGSADCRKPNNAGGMMCPTYFATRNEYYSTRARVNLLREVLSNPNNNNPFISKELYKILDGCLSCKACKAECPSNIDLAKFKAEFFQKYYDFKGIGLRALLFAHIAKISNIFCSFAASYNKIIKSKLFSPLIKTFLNIASERQLPAISTINFYKWYKNYIRSGASSSYNLNKFDYINNNQKQLILYIDELIACYDADLAIKTYKLFEKLGYKIHIIKLAESGRTYISKGLLRKAKKFAETNVMLLRDIVTKDLPLVGIEPSAILSFRDEYLSLVNDELKKDAIKIADNCLLYDEFIIREKIKGNISSEQFTKIPAQIILHGHCHQKVLASIEPSAAMLSIPVNYKVDIIPSGCCGMAGAFGYEKKYYQLSMKIGEQVLFPYIHQKGTGKIISAPGLSCREQIFHGTGLQALHPLEILYKALI